jgi:hypothetical protein
MTITIAELVERLALPPDGIDLRAELDALQSARVSQALAQSSGDLAQAARLLRMSRLELLRLEERLAGRAPEAFGRRREPEPDVTPIPRIEGGLEIVSAAAIRRLAADGFTERQIGARLGCNPYIVEKVLREDIERDVRRLDAEGRSVTEIAVALRLPFSRVRGILVRAHAAGRGGEEQDAS